MTFQKKNSTIWETLRHNLIRVLCAAAVTSFENMYSLMNVIALQNGSNIFPSNPVCLPEKYSDRDLKRSLLIFSALEPSKLKNEDPTWGFFLFLSEMYPCLGLENVQ